MIFKYGGAVRMGLSNNFEIGGGGGYISDSILGAHKTLFHTNSL